MDWYTREVLSIYLIVNLLLFSSAFSAKYRSEKSSYAHKGKAPISSPKDAERIHLLSSSDDSMDSHNSYPSLVKSTSSRSSVFGNGEAGKLFKTPKYGQPGYFNRDNITRRKARVIYNSGLGYTEEESLRLAHKQLTERRRVDSEKYRNKSKDQGIKKKKATRKKGYNGKEAVISRKIVQLLGEDNHIVRHKDAREAAEEWYKASARERSASHRARKKEAKALQTKSNSSDYSF
ncbi:uncharacterized protein FA14DRAFT_183851 [Meira miltonrushii]|uniref:Uncharacterized protein n=1 Tax=Meira miltonrushii TaxID=1280837 RepID=A0A316VMG2_9BASI|nr:uncharacterized protein FA14DRAFT_183851 [Meira miltonrushii]PWN38490.1 hypothetical protein FA14DRAFT_183851 [Meira miltonrushii]